MRRAARSVLVAWLLAAGCTRSEQAIDLKAAFSDDTVVGHLAATWTATEERASGRVAERAVIVRVDAVNLLADRLYLRLAGMRLIGPNGPIELEQGRVKCALPPHVTQTLIQTSVWVPVADAAAIDAIEVDSLAVPLSQRGRLFYREFLLQKRPGAFAAIDSELDAYAAVPPCPAASP